MANKDRRLSKEQLAVIEHRKRILEEANIPYIWSKDIYKHDNIDRKNTLLKYFIAGDGHPTTYNNKLIAEEIKKRVIQITK